MSTPTVGQTITRAPRLPVYIRFRNFFARAALSTTGSSLGA